MTMHARVSPWGALNERIYQGIARLLIDNRLDPTPAHYAMAHRYLTGQDPEFNVSPERPLRTEGLSPAASAAMVAERSVELSAADLHVIAAEAQARLVEVSGIVARSRHAAQDYGKALASNAADLEAGAPARAVVGPLTSRTRSMIDRTRGVEEQLRAACDEIRNLRDNLTEAQDLANRDALTGLPNRRALDLRLAAALAEAHRSRRPLSIAMCDIDHFKAFNDRFGHQIGDEVIKLVAAGLAGDGRDNLFAARYGGEEFVVLFEGLDAITARAKIDNVRIAIGSRELRVHATGQALGKLTFSAGVAQFGPKDGDISAVLHRADAALYKAKRAGRNRVIVD
jgi:diguanylate cyclase